MAKLMIKPNGKRTLPKKLLIADWADMIGFANAKINIGLKVGEERSDGFHEIQTYLFPIPWYDVVEIIPTPNFQFGSAGILIPGHQDDNLCRRAFELVKKERGIGNVHIFLLKNIPIGAGLAGGSSDGVTTLLLLNELFSLELTQIELKQMAAKLGSDCPFFVDNKPVISTGRGEQLQQLSAGLNGLHIVVIYPGIEISTKWAYDEVVPSADIQLPPINALPKDQWQNSLINDFQSPVENKYPCIKEIRESLNNIGAIYSSLSGSGSAVFGVYHSMEFSRKELAATMNVGEDQVFTGKL